GLALSRESKLTLYSLHHMGSLGYAHALSGRAADGIQMLQDALTGIDAMKYGLADLILLEDLGEAYLAADRLPEAREIAGPGRAPAPRRGQPRSRAPAPRPLGEITGGP